MDHLSDSYTCYGFALKAYGPGACIWITALPWCQSVVVGEVGFSCYRDFFCGPICWCVGQAWQALHRISPLTPVGQLLLSMSYT